MVVKSSTRIRVFGNLGPQRETQGRFVNEVGLRFYGGKPAPEEESGRAFLEIGDMGYSGHATAPLTFQGIAESEGGAPLCASGCAPVCARAQGLAKMCCQISS